MLYCLGNKLDTCTIFPCVDCFLKTSQDNAKFISSAAIKKFAKSFVKLGNINLINDVLKVIHGSGYKIDQVTVMDLYEIISVNILFVFVGGEACSFVHYF
jgi:hypothetical protein